MKKSENIRHRSRSPVRYERKSPLDRTVLVYNDIRLNQNDVQTLRPFQWISDQIISFYFLYLESQVYHEQSILLISPQVTQLLKMSENRVEEAENLLEFLDFRSKQYLFFPVNDSDEEKNKGTHWSLLVFSRPEKKFFTFDSIDKQNSFAASKLCDVLRVVLNCSSAENIYFPSAQQKNSYDCGIFVICNVENIINHIIHGGEVDNVPELNQEDVLEKRKEILKVIESLGGVI